MSTTIDNKVVSMEFQNDRFEKNIAQTQTSLERLKKSLRFNGASKGFEELQKSADKVDLNTIANSIDNINSKFNVMTYAAAAAVANVTDRFVNMGINLTKSLSIDQLTAGWEKYNEKTANVQTIMNATGKSVEEVNDILGELQWFSDETSYSFTQMTKAFADMTSKGGDADKVKDMVMGIAEATAFAGKTGNEFSRVIYNLSQAYGSKLLVKDWMSIENAGVNSEQLIKTLIAAGEKAGTIRKGAVTVATFRDSLSKGWVTSTVMEDAFSGWYAMMKEANRLVNDEHAFDTAAEAIASLEGQYDSYVEKATKAAQTAKSFNEAVDATKDAVSSQWSRIWESIFGNYEQASELWTEVVEGMWTAFAEPISNTADRIEEVMGLGSAYTDFSAKLENAGISGESFRSELVKIGVELGTLDKETAETTENINDLFTKEKGGWLTDNVIVTTLKRFQGTMDGVGDATKSVAMTFEELESVAKRVINGEFGNGTERVKKLEEAGYKAATVQSLVNKMMYKQAINAEDYADALKEMSSSQLESINLTEEQRAELAKLIEETGSVEEGFKKLAESMTKPSGRELLIDSFRIMIVSTANVINEFKESFRTFFPKKTSSQLYEAIERFHAFAESLEISEKNLKKFRRAFDGLFAAIDIVLRLISIPFNFALKVLDTVLRKLGLTSLDLAANIGDVIVKFHDWLFVSGPLANALNNTAEAVGTIIAKVITLWGKFKELPLIKKIAELAGKAWSKLGDIFEELKKRVEKFRESIRELRDNETLSISSVWKAFKTDILNDFQDISDWFDKFEESGNKVGAAFSSAFNSARIDTGGFLSKLKTFGSSMLDAIFGKENGQPWGAPEVVAILSGVAIGKLTSAFASAIRSFDGLAGAASGVLDSISGMFKNISGILKSFKYQVWTIGLLNIAKAILFLAGAVFLLAKTPNVDKAIVSLRHLVEIFILLAGAMTLLSIAMNKWGSGGSFKLGKQFSAQTGGFFAMAATILSMGLAMLALGKALKLVDSIEPDKLVNDVLALIAVMVALGFVAGAVNRVSSGIATGAITILAVGLAIKSVVKAMLKLQELLVRDDINWTQMYGSITAIGIILVALTKVLGSVADWKAGLAVVGLALAFKLIVGTLEDIGDLDAAKIRNNADIVLAAIFTMIAIMAATNLLGKNVSKAGASLMGIIGAMALLVLVIKMTQDIKPEQSQHTLAVLKPILIAIGGIMIASYFTGKYAARAGALLAGVGFALILIAAAIRALANIPESDIKKASNALMKIEALFALLILAVSDIETSKFKMNKSGKFGPIVAIGIVIAILAALVILIAKSKNLDKIEQAIKMMSILIVALGGLLFAMSKLDDIKVKFGTLFSIVVVVGLLGGIILALAKFMGKGTDPNLLWAAAGSIAVLALVVAAISIALEKFDVGEKVVSKPMEVIKRLLPALGLVVVLMAALVGVSHLMNGSIKPSQLLAMAAATSILAIVVVAITAALTLITSIPNQGAWYKGILAILPGLIVIGALMAGLAILSNKFNSSNLDIPTLLALTLAISTLAKTVMVIAAVMTLLGSTGGPGIAAGLAGIVIVLEALVGLALIIAAMVGISEALKALYKDNVIEETEKLAEIMTNVGAAIGGFIGGLGGAVIKTFIEGILGIGDAISQFGKSLTDSGLTLDSANLIAALAASFIALGAADVVNAFTNIADFLTGGNFKLKANDFKELGEMIEAFNKATKKIDASRSKVLATLTDSVKDMAKAFKTLGEAGGVDLTDFATDCTNLGDGFVAFGEASKSVDTAAVQKGVDAGNIISDFQKGLYGSGGIVQLIAGEKDLGTFSLNMGMLAAGLVAFGETINGSGEGQTAMDKDAIQKGVDAANLIAAIDVPSMGGLISLFTGTNDLASFGIQLGFFAGGLKTFINKMAKCSDSDMGLAERGIDIANKLSKVEMDISKLDAALGEETASLFKRLNAQVDDYCGQLISDIRKRNSELEDAGKGFIDAFFKGANNAGNSTKWDSFVQNMIGNIGNSASTLRSGLVSGISLAMGGLSTIGYNSNISIGSSKAGVANGITNTRIVGTVKCEVGSVLSAINSVRSAIQSQNSILHSINSNSSKKGNVYLDGKVLVGYVDRALGSRVGSGVITGGSGGKF